MQDIIMAVDLGATKTLVAAGTRAGLLEKRKFLTRSERSATAILDDIAGQVDSLLSKYLAKGGHLKGIAVGSPGPISYPQAVVYNSPNLGWEKVPLREELEKRLGYQVQVENDAGIAALGEYYYGGSPAVHLLYLTISTGVGAGIVAGGKLYRGEQGGAGEIGHMIIDSNGAVCGCGRRGCVEALISGTAIAGQVQILVDQGGGQGILACAAAEEKKPVGAYEVGIAARKGDREAQGIVDKFIDYLVITLVNLVHAFNPGKLVLGGGVAQGWQDLVLKKVRSRVLDLVFPMYRQGLQIEVTQLGEDIVLYGCLAAIAQGR